MIKYTFFFLVVFGLVFFVLLSNTNVYAQSVPLNQEWMARYNGPANSVNGIVADTFGNVYVTGNINRGNGNTYIVTVKYDSNGNQLWVVTYDNGINDVAFDIAMDTLGNVYVTGGSDVGTMFEYVTIKYDSNGNQLWAARYDGGIGSCGGVAFSISVDDLMDVYVAGNISYCPWGSGDDYVTIKYDSNGNQLSIERYDNPGNPDSALILLDNMGNVYTAEASGTVTSSDYAIVKYDSIGNQLWVAQYDSGKDQDDIPIAISIDDLGNIYVTGSSQKRNQDGEFLNYDYATVKYDSNGNQLWVVRYDNGGDDTASAMLVDNLGNIYVTGISNGDYLTIKYAPNNTPLGSNITISLYSGTTVTFSDVISAGDTTVITSAAGPASPAGFQLGDPAIYYDIRTTATFNSPATVCIDYVPSQYADPNILRLFHYENDVWTDVTLSNDTLAGNICGQVSIFSPFAIMQPFGLPSRTFARGSGAPVVKTVIFSSVPGNATLKIYNGGLVDGEYEKVSSSVIKLNGVQIVGPSNFNQGVSFLAVSVTLQAGNNIIEVEVRGKPGGAITIVIE